MLEPDEFKKQFYEIPEKTRDAFWKAVHNGGKGIVNNVLHLQTDDDETWEALSGNEDALKFARVLNQEISGIELIRADKAKEWKKKKNKADDGSRFIKLVIPEHVEKVQKWCEHSGIKSAPKAIARAIDLAYKYEEEISELHDELRAWKMAVKSGMLTFKAQS